MSGFIQDPLQIINLIADNIRDRYKTGFSVIKEIIQNADDAGGGKTGGSSDGGGNDDGGDNGGDNFHRISIEFGLSPGLPDSDHPLLRGPALFFLNNGRFTQSDAIAIRSFGLNRKAIDESTIGKFGLGMKSVFHFCEAFFFLAQDQDQSYAEILNPWSGPAEFHSLHNDWDEFSSRDAETLKGHLDKVIGPYRENGKSWFLLLLPLRTKNHINANGQGVGSIVAEFPGDDLSRLDFLKEFQMPRRLARLLPLLRRIGSIRFWELSNSIDKIEPAYLISMVSPDQRTNFPLITSCSLAGQILCSNGVMATDKYQICYAGLERHLRSKFLDDLRASNFWPRSYVRDDDGRSRKADDKAKGHCAAVFFRYSTNGKSRLDIRWAVFLPIETDHESIPCEGEGSYCLTLHGYFFVDAGRAEVSGIRSTDPIGNGTPPGNEAELRQQWNEYLAQNGTLKLVIPALVDFTRQAEINSDEIHNLCHALGSSDTFGRHRSAICREEKFVLQLLPSGSKWESLPADTKLLPLPAPPVSDPSRPWRTFQSLSKFQDSPHFILDGAPHLISAQSPPTWSEPLLEKLLDIDVDVVFMDQGLLSYLQSFLTADNIRLRLQKDALQLSLRDILKAAVKIHGRKLTRHKKLFQEIGAMVFPTYRFPILGKWNEVLDELLQCETQIVILPKELDSAFSSGTASLRVEDAVILLRKIGIMAARHEEKKNVEYLDDCRQLSEQIIKGLHPTLVPEVLDQVPSAKIIGGVDCVRNNRSLFSVKELREGREANLLFLFSQGTTEAQWRGLAMSLQQTIRSRVMLINSRTAQLIFGPSHELVPCHAKSCLKALGTKALPLTTVEQREALIQECSGISLNQDDWVRGMRYLLHGQPKYFYDDHVLWTRGYHQNPVWEKMWRQLPFRLKRRKPMPTNG